MELGVFHEFSRLPGESEADVFTSGFEIVDAAERWGLDVMWLAEHHFVSNSVLASPLAIAAAIAGRTERMKIGTAVQVLPLGNPLRLAEEWASVDQLSRGRLIFGVGRSGFARTYHGYGISYAESRERFAEALAVIKQAWTEPSLTFHGAYYDYDNVAVMPKPYQQPHPPIRVAATTPETFPVLGRQGYPCFGAVRQGNLTDLIPDIQAYRAAWREAGHPGEGGVFLRIPIYIAETAAQAQDEPHRSIMDFYRAMGDQLIESSREPGVGDAEIRRTRGEALLEITYEEVQREKVVIGTPEQVVARLGQLRDELGIAGVLAELNCGRNIPHPNVMRSLQLLCTEVMPALSRVPA
ncbi:MAG: LLM class flavin-dependent oxidoreductase [Chloroflexi bacterium]|nr:LLM class flavin-dependent oxidoreductase [Chloroflexota bacterium]